jgi:hypothetical protein
VERGGEGMSAGAIRAGKAVIELAVKNDMARGLNKAKAQLQKFGNTTRNIGAALFGGAAAMALPFVGAIKSASDFEESLNRFNAVFKGNAAAAKAFAEDYGEAVGRSDKQMLDSLATFQSFFVGLGKGADEASNLSKELAKASIDFASFNNLSDEEAMERFLSAMSGSSEVLRPFGVDISAAALKLRGITTASTEAEKAAARYAIIVETMTKQGSMGDALTTAGSYANQLKALNAEFDNAKVALGNAVLPLINDMVKQVVPLVKLLAAWIEENKELVKGIFIAVVVVGSFGAALVIIGTALSAIGTVIGFVLSPVGLFVAALVAIVASSKELREGFMGAASAIAGTFMSAFNDVSAAMGSGDMGHAMDVGLAHVKLAWVEVVSEIEKIYFASSVAILKGMGDNLKWFFQLAKKAQDFTGISLGSKMDRGIAFLAADSTDLSKVIDAGFSRKLQQIDKRRQDAQSEIDELNKKTDRLTNATKDNSNVTLNGEGGVDEPSYLESLISKIEGQIKGATRTILPGALEQGSLEAAQTAFENDERQRFKQHMKLLAEQLAVAKKMLARDQQVIMVAPG